MAGNPDPKTPARAVDPTAGSTKVVREGRCRACGVQTSGHPLAALNRAHLVPKGQGGDDLDNNLVPLCGSGVTGCHGALTTHHPASAPSLLAGEPWEVVASFLRRRLRAQEIEYVISKKGRDWLDRVYPGMAGQGGAGHGRVAQGESPYGEARRDEFPGGF